jgi:EAL domain-containing protein (putative c-di-GMP-specific phosphodiesterase class I)
VRGLDPDSTKVLSPAEIIPAAERFGMISMIDRWVVLAALKAMDSGLLNEFEIVSVNLSGASVGNRSFCDYLVAVLGEFAHLADRVCFEITETMAVQHPERTADFMDRIRARGSTFSVDDCGAGAASFGFLRSLPFDSLKVDGQFVRRLATEATDVEIVTAMVRIAGTLNIPTVAECVETEEDVRRALDLGVDYLQGWAIGRPEIMEAPWLWLEAAEAVLGIEPGTRTEHRLGPLSTEPQPESPTEPQQDSQSVPGASVALRWGLAVGCC